MTDDEDPKKHVEALIDPIDPYPKYPLALGSWENGARRSSKYVFFPDGSLRPVKTCTWASLLTIGGESLTGSDGRVELLLSNVHCGGPIQVVDPVIVVATAHTSAPVFVTAVPEIINDGGDVRIVAYAWRADGNPARSLRVGWLCRVSYFPVIESPTSR